MGDLLKSETEGKPDNASDQRAAADEFETLAMENRKKSQRHKERAQALEREAADERMIAQQIADRISGGGQ